MAKSLSIIIGIAALLLFQPHSALQAEPSPWDRITWTVTKSGWMNLRKMQSNAPAFNGDRWYVCGQRKVIAFWEIQKPEDDKAHDVLGKEPVIGEEFFGSRRLISLADNFMKDPKFAASASAACAAPASSEPPEWMNLIELPDGTHFYLLPRDFLVNGPIRTFWVSAHSSRKVVVRSKIGADGKPLSGYGSDEFDRWLIKYRRQSISRMEINCDAGQVRTLLLSSYVASVPSITRPTEIALIVPDTAADAWREVVCLIK